jgi:16S rRNA G966 N2-methylase RsmD
MIIPACAYLFSTCSRCIDTKKEYVATSHNGANEMLVKYYRDKRNQVFLDPAYQQNLGKDMKACKDETESLIEADEVVRQQISDMGDLSSQLTAISGRLDRQEENSEEKDKEFIERSAPLMALLQWWDKDGGSIS